jgi:transcriptional regulator with XRE-family HTH domain
MRRLFLGMNQESLAKALGLTFQQIQKYEGGANRVSASRLSKTAEVLGVPVSFFFSDIPAAENPASKEDEARRERLHRPESIDLVRFYYAIQDPEIRNRFLDMVKAVAHPAESNG